MPRYQDIPKLPTTSLGARYKAPTLPAPPTYTYEDKRGRRKKTHIVTLGESYLDIAEK